MIYAPSFSTSTGQANPLIGPARSPREIQLDQAIQEGWDRQELIWEQQEEAFNAAYMKRRRDYEKTVWARIAKTLADLGDIITDPATLTRIITNMGFVGFIVNQLPGLIGIAASAVVTSAPGLVQGDDFANAFIAEITRKGEMILKIFGPIFAEKAIQQIYVYVNDPRLQDIKVQVDALKGRGGGYTTKSALRELGVSPTSLARRCREAGGDPAHCRADQFAMAFNAIFSEPLYNSAAWDPKTGNPIRRPAPCLTNEVWIPSGRWDGQRWIPNPAHLHALEIYGDLTPVPEHNDLARAPTWGVCVPKGKRLGRPAGSQPRPGQDSGPREPIIPYDVDDPLQRRQAALEQMRRRAETVEAAGTHPLPVIEALRKQYEIARELESKRPRHRMPRSIPVDVADPVSSTVLQYDPKDPPERRRLALDAMKLRADRVANEGRLPPSVILALRRQYENAVAAETKKQADDAARAADAPLARGNALTKAATIALATSPIWATAGAYYLGRRQRERVRT